MKFLLIICLFTFSLFAKVPEHTQECQDLYDDAKVKLTELEPVLKVKIASKVAWDLIHTYIDSATLAISKCEPGGNLDFRKIRELRVAMIRADKQRAAFRVQTFNAMVAQARREGRCTNIYQSYGKR